MPPARPRVTLDEFLARTELHQARLAGRDLYVAGFRNYYPDSMGAPGRNDRGIYDDAIVLVIHGQIHAFNGNTDPSRFRAGHGDGAGKGMAVLKPGFYDVHRFDVHRRGTPGAHLALCQRGGPVTVLRDGANGPQAFTGNYGINIHRGGNTTTSSEGCQTIPPGQWSRFIAAATVAAKSLYGSAWQQTNIPYVLVDWS